MDQDCSRKDRPFGVSGDSAPLCTYTQTRVLPLRLPLPCSHPTTTPPRRRCFCLQLSAWSRPFLFEYYGQTFHSNSTRKCTNARRLQTHPQLPISQAKSRAARPFQIFLCPEGRDLTRRPALVGEGRNRRVFSYFHPPSFRFDLLTKKILIQSYALVASVSLSRDVNNPRHSRFFERRKEEDPVRRCGDRYYGAGVDWMDASLLKFSLPSTTDTNDSEEMRGVELRKRTIEYSSRIEPDRNPLSNVHIARTSGTSSERRRKAAPEGREEPSASADAGLMDGASAEPDAIRQGHRIVNCVRSSKYAECDSRVDVGRLRLAQGYFGERNGSVVLKYRKIDVAAGLSLDESKGEASEEEGPVFAYISVDKEHDSTLKNVENALRGRFQICRAALHNAQNAACGSCGFCTSYLVSLIVWQPDHLESVDFLDSSQDSGGSYTVYGNTTRSKEIGEVHSGKAYSPLSRALSTYLHESHESALFDAYLNFIFVELLLSFSAEEVLAKRIRSNALLPDVN
ncbi:hypothetical protein B0H13DRAFT_2272677 [Mycena leptocephala]|nr:hypothetical protein B0H13DRAFT_2272677 [Mycena leptocephala]